jgi:hypothetical protein
MKNIFVCRIAPRTHRRGMPRGTLLAPTEDINNINLNSDFRDYYSKTFGTNNIPESILLEFGQPPFEASQLLIKEDDYIILLLGSDDPDGGENQRGILGIGKVEKVHLAGSGNSARCAIKVKILIRLAHYLDNPSIKSSRYFQDSKISDIGIFGLNQAPQAHNCVRFFLPDDDQDARQNRIRAFLGMLIDIDSTIISQLKSNCADLASLIPNALPIKTDEDLIVDLIDAFASDLQSVKLRYAKHTVIRFLASMFTKRFVILTGLSGSGKTKLAQAFAHWITKPCNTAHDPFTPGAKIQSDRICYYVKNSDKLSVEFWNSQDASATKVVLPRSIIDEWILSIESNGFNIETPARTIRDAVSPISQYSPQLHSFETHLKAAAFAKIKAAGNHFGFFMRYAMIAVGADWTSNENVLGYQDALQPNLYRKPSSGALDVILSAVKDSENPYLLILDEMNLSHVERYFADLLSAIESGEEVALHASQMDLNSGDGDSIFVPAKIRLPKNLFIIGTVNVDETTYMFSPKVLDRANVIEFKASADAVEAFLDSPGKVEMDKLAGKGASYGATFVRMASSSVSPTDLALVIADGAKVAQDLKAKLMKIFNQLVPVGAEFGFRTAFEINRFFFYHAILTGPGWKFNDALDAQVIQKLMPKLHGSDRKLRPTLEALKKFCTDHDLTLSLEKTNRMLDRLTQDGFTSFAEA